MGLREEIADIKEEVNEVKEKSLAWEMLEDAKKTNKRMFIIIITILSMWFITIGYLVYVLNDIGTIETVSTQEVSQENTDGNNNYIGNNGDINNG